MFVGPASHEAGKLSKHIGNLKKGDVIVFRGDVRHNGVGYIEDNYRIHAYIDSPYIKRNPNRIFNGESADSTTP